MQISKYFASLGIEIDKASVKQVDATLSAFENRIRKFGNRTGKGLGLSKFSLNQTKLEGVLLKGLEAASAKLTFDIRKFDVNQTALNVAIGTALDIASARNTFQIARFHVDQLYLNTAMAAAMREATLFASRGSTLRPNVHANPLNGGGSGLRPRHAVIAGGIAGGASRGMPGLLGPALALGLGGYGLANLNERNQQIVSAQLQTSAVVQQAGGTAQQGADSFQYLRSEGARVGFNYLDASQDYNKLISGLTGSGIGLKESQKVFSGFAELARVNKLDKTTQNRLFRALSQVAGKGKLMSEELTGQIAEALPGGTALFAQAYQKQIGGNKTGSDAIQQLLADMKKGKVKSDILTYAGAAASERANQGGALGTASQASQAEQARYQNTVNDLAVVASNSGVEEGFARIFRTLNAGLSESNGLVRTLSEGFNDATKWADDLLLWPQSFIRALEGKDSLVADWLGEKSTKELIADWNQIKALWVDINSVKSPDWLPALESTTKELKSLLDAIARLKGTKDQANGIIQEEYDKDPTLSGNLKGLAKANWFTFRNTVDALNPMDMTVAKRNWGGWLGIDSWKNSQDELPKQFDTPLDQLNFSSDEAAARQEDLLRKQLMVSLNRKGSGGGLGFDMPTGLETTLGLYPDNSKGNSNSFYGTEESNKQAALEAASQTVTNTQTNQFDITIQVDSATLAGMDMEQQAQLMADAFSNQLMSSFEQVGVNFPMKE